MTKRPTASDTPIRLSDFANERQVLANDPAWRTIAGWQKQGFVTLRWTDTKNHVFVRLTERGVQQAAKGSVILA